MSTQTQSRNGTGSTNKVQPSQSTNVNYFSQPAFKSVGGPNIPLKLQSDLYSRGLETAQASRTQKPRAEDIEALENLARAMARQTSRLPYDPNKNLYDAQMEEEFQRDKDARDKLEERLENASAAIRNAKQAKAKLPVAVKPQMPFLVMSLTGLVIALSLSPTFNDYFFFNVQDDVLRWFFSIGAGSAVGFTVAWMALRYIDLKGQRDTKVLNGFLISAFLLAMGLGAFRMINAQDPNAFYFGLALTVVEFALMLMLEMLARRFRAAFREYETQNDAQTSADRDINLAEENRSSIEEQISQKQNKIAAHIEYVEWRAVCNENIDEIVEAAVTAVRAGYNAGVAGNQGDIITA